MLTYPEMITSALQRTQAGNWLPQELQARRDNLRKGQNALQSQLDRPSTQETRLGTLGINRRCPL